MARIEPRKRTIGPLECLEIEGAPEGPTVVLFHGYGADMHDLAPLAGVIQAPRGTNWYFPNGHISIPMGDHHEGRAWFPIPLAELEAGGSIDLTAAVPPGMKRARENAQAFIEKLNVPHSKLVLGGFSQGAMLATDVVLRMETPPAGLALLSGTLVNSAEWTELAKKKPGVKFFQAHGVYDQILSFVHAQRLEEVLKHAGWQGQLQKFHGAHEIPPEVLIQLGSFIRKVVG